VSHTLWLETSDGATKTGGDRDNSIMLRLSESLDALAAQLGVTPLSAFHDYSTVAREYASELREFEEVAATQPEAWYDAVTGLSTVDAINRELQARPESLAFTPDASRRHWRDTLLEELDAAVRASRMRRSAASGSVCSSCLDRGGGSVQTHGTVHLPEALVKSNT
jgi:hypothetical protein